MIARSEAAILSRIIEPEKPEMPVSAARLILQWEFSESDRQRMHDLLAKAKSGRMTRREKRDAQNYERVGHFLSVLKSKARISLKARKSAS